MKYLVRAKLILLLIVADRKHRHHKHQNVPRVRTGVQYNRIVVSDGGLRWLFS